MQEIRSKLQREQAEYSQGEDRPLTAYAGGMAIYSGVVLTLAAVARAQRRTLPTPTPFEVLLLATATHKLARLISKENITSALRAPFTRYEGPGGPGWAAGGVRRPGGKAGGGGAHPVPFLSGAGARRGVHFGFGFRPPPPPPRRHDDDRR